MFANVFSVKNCDLKGICYVNIYCVARELPEDEWFNDLCQDAMERLSGKPKEINGEKDPNSPTASVSAQSISSVRSHNSS